MPKHGKITKSEMRNARRQQSQKARFDAKRVTGFTSCVYKKDEEFDEPWFSRKEFYTLDPKSDSRILAVLCQSYSYRGSFSEMEGAAHEVLKFSGFVPSNAGRGETWSGEKLSLLRLCDAEGYEAAQQILEIYGTEGIPAEAIRNISLIAAKQAFFTKRDCSPSPGVEAAGVFGIVLIFLVPFMLCALRERCKRSSRAHDQVSNSDLAEPLMTGESMDPAQESQEIQSSRCEGIVKKLKSAVSTPVLNLSRMCCQRLSSEKAVGPEDDTYLAEGL